MRNFLDDPTFQATWLYNDVDIVENIDNINKHYVQQRVEIARLSCDTSRINAHEDFCFQHEDATPDILILGKSLGGGLLPISAAVSRKEVMDVMGPGEHGSTFGGNPLACAVAREAMRVLKGEQLSLRSAEMGAKVMDRLHSQPLPKVKEVRGKGSLIGIEMDPSAGGARRYCEELASRGVLCKETHEHVIRIAPPLNIPENELLEGVERIIQVIQRG